MNSWFSAARAMSWRGRMVLAGAGAALVLVAVVPVALLTGLILMLAGHAVGGLALFGGSVLAAVVAVTIAAKAGVRHLRSLVRQAMEPLATSPFATGTTGTSNEGTANADARAKGTRVIRLDQSEYRIG